MAITNVITPRTTLPETMDDSPAPRSLMYPLDCTEQLHLELVRVCGALARQVSARGPIDDDEEVLASAERTIREVEALG